MTTTYHTYPNLMTSGGRLAATDWGKYTSPAEAVAATLRVEPEAIVLRIDNIRGLAPGGLA